MAIRFNSTDSINNFFNTSLGKKNNTSNIFESINLNDYNSLKTGTYKKLLRSYYDKNNVSEDGKKDEVKDKLLSNISTNNGINKEISDNTDKINKSVDELKKIEYKESNRSDITKYVSNLVSSYNKVLDNVDDSKESDLSAKGKWMTNYTKTFKNDLSKIGIEITENNRLKLDEKVLDNANLDDIEHLFVPKSSFGNNLVTISGIDTYL